MFESKMRVMSIGIAAENKALSSNLLSVIPIEAIPLIDGDLLDSITSIETSGVDATGAEYTVKVKTSPALKTTWLPMGSNRITAPDVRRGERLLIWQYADTDKYYWSPMGLDDDLRRLETLIYAWSATKDDNEELDVTKNMYTLEISTHAKHLTLRTTKANDEPYAYTIQLNTKEGVFFISDDDGNVIELNSKKRKIVAKNADATEVLLDKKFLYGYSKDKMEFHCDGPATVRAPKIQLGEDSDVEQSVLGETHADGHQSLEDQINASQVIGNLGVPTSTIMSVKKVEEPILLPDGDSYSKKNTNQ